MQKLFIIGSLTRDPETRTTQSGTSVCTFNVAVNRRFAGTDGEKKTDFFRVNAWRGLADTCQKHLAKGRKVAVTGELQPNPYTAKDGTTKFSLDVSADEVEFLTPAVSNTLPGDAYKEKEPENSGFTLLDDDTQLPF